MLADVFVSALLAAGSVVVLCVGVVVAVAVIVVFTTPCSASERYPHARPSRAVPHGGETNR